MADRFAAAAMMAGHPNEASLLGLRDLPFALFMGGDDAAYNRNKIAASRAADLDSLAQTDPGGYVHFARIYPGLGHWMKKQDAEALPWMAKFRRDPWPKKVVWQQDDVVHHRFYWLQIPGEIPVKDRQKTVASVDGQMLAVKYKDGEKKIVVPPDATILAYAAGERGELKVGAKVAILRVKQKPNGALEADRINVGRGDVAPR